MKYKDKKTFLSAFVVIFLISFLFFNWSEVSWLFNYKFYSEVVSNFFEKDIQETFEKGKNAENVLKIPEINVSVPLIIGESSNLEDLEKDLRNGVVYFPDSVLPGKKGQTIILGHSAPTGWPKINYDWVFTNIYDLVQGDKIFINYNNREYVYIVKDKVILNKGEETPKSLTNNRNMLLLISCWPPGKDYKRIVVEAELLR